MKRAAQKLLAERRANVEELLDERCPMFRKMLRAHIAAIDVELKAVRP